MENTKVLSKALTVDELMKQVEQAGRTTYTTDELIEFFPPMLETMGITKGMVNLAVLLDSALCYSTSKNPAQVHIYNDGIVLGTRYVRHDGTDSGPRLFFIKGKPTYIDASLCEIIGWS